MNAWPETRCDRRLRACGLGAVAGSGDPDYAGRLSRYQRSLEANDDYADDDDTAADTAADAQQHGFING
jgi:hypothetical protein